MLKLDPSRDVRIPSSTRPAASLYLGSPFVNLLFIIVIAKGLPSLTPRVRCLAELGERFLTNSCRGIGSSFRENLGVAGGRRWNVDRQGTLS